MRVVVTGAAGAIGRRVVTRLAGDGFDVVAVDKARLPSTDSVVEKRVDLAVADLASLFAGADVVVHLASPMTASSAATAEAQLELAIVRRVLDAMSEATVPHIVIVSSAMVYGAWPGNPVPLTEDAPVRPNRDFHWAVQRVAVERLVEEWRSGREGAVASILRPAAIVSDDQLGQLARTLHAARVGVAADGDPPVQYLHVDDLASAIATVVGAGFDGVANVAPDGWIPPAGLADLEGPRPRVRVPAAVARVFSALRWRAGLAPTPPGVVPYTVSAWVVANDRLRRLGWEPMSTNEEAWVVSHDPSPLERIPARRRQEVALAVAGVGIVAVAVAVIVAVSRVRRRRS